MDPAAQTNPFDPAPGTDQINPGPIQPGQFVVAEQTNHSQQLSQSVPEAEPEPKNPTNPYMPPVNPAPMAGSPDELLQNILKPSGEKPPDFAPPPPANEPLPPNPVVAPMAETIATDLSSATPPQSVLPEQTPNSPNGPDPTPFSAGEAMAAPPPAPEPSSGGDKIKVFLLVIGAFALIGIIGASAWYFVLNKPKEDVKTENLASEIEADLPEVPKRTGGGFASLPLPSSIEASPAAGQDLTGTNPELTDIENSLNSSSLP